MQQLRRFGVGCILLVYLPCFAQEIVKEIRFHGNRRVSDEAITYRLATRVGQALDDAVVTKDIKELWNTGLFDNLGVQKEPAEGGGIIVTFILRELPIVTEVDYRGHRKLGKSTITDKIEEERLTISEDTPLDYRKVNAIRKLIKGLLDDRGLRNGKVTYSLERLDAGTARVVFNIYEGSKVRIYEIDFDGNEKFSDAKLRRMMRKTKEHWWFSWLTQHDVFNEEKYEEDVERVKKKYWERGYKDILLGDPIFTVEDHTSERQKRKNIERLKKARNPKEDLRMDMTIPVFEGKPYYMGKLEIEGNNVIPTVVYQAMFPLREGDLYDLGKVNEWITNLEELYNNTGYLYYSVQQDVTIRDSNTVDALFKVSENDQIYVNRIGFAGNITTRDKVLRREVLVREGDVFRLNYFRNSLLRINQLGYFDVSHDQPDIKPLPNENKVNITIKGQESGVNELNFGIGYSDFRGRNGFLSFSTLNFLGRGEILKVQAQVGSISDTYDLTFSEPWLFDKPRGFTARIFDTQIRFPGFLQQQRGFQTGLSFRPSTFSTYGITYQFTEVTIPANRIQAPIYSPTDGLLTSSVNQSFTYNTTDHPFFPTRGHKLYTTFELAGWQSGGDSLFYKYTLGGTKYFKAFKKTFFGLNVKGSVMDTFEDQRPQYFELFSLGGDESVRGYRNHLLGPAIFSGGVARAARGDKLFQANLEFVIPVSDQFRFVVFYDAGQIFGLDETWFETDLAMSTGLEMRFSLPVFQAPLRLIYAYKLTNTAFDEKGGEPRFSIGTTF